MPTTLQEMKERFTAAEIDIDGNIRVKVSAELYCDLDMCNMTKVAHIEHL